MFSDPACLHAESLTTHAVSTVRPWVELAPGFHVHPPEDGFPIPASENTMRLLKQQLGGTYLYPVHRLDRPTSGVVVFCTTR